MNTTKEARRDAREYARAQMFYGEGAGTRRKLIANTVDAKAHRDPTYARAFHAELGRQDMAEHAQKARAERRRMDRTEAVGKNTRAVLRGDKRSMSTSVLVVGTALYLAHQTGLDVKAYHKAKDLVAQAKEKYKKNKPVVIHNITHIHQDAGYDK